jgi:hypothetical protein
LVESGSCASAGNADAAMSAMDRMLFIGTLPAEDSEGLVTIARCDARRPRKWVMGTLQTRQHVPLRSLPAHAAGDSSLPVA